MGLPELVYLAVLSLGAWIVIPVLCVLVFLVLGAVGIVTTAFDHARWKRRRGE